MEEIKDVVQRIVQGCAHGGLVVSEVLAAFVARTIVEAHSTAFALDQRLTSSAKDEVVIQSIEKLLEKDSPQLETMKMQVDFDSTFWNEDNEFQKVIKLRNKILSTHKIGIIELEMANASDFETLTLLYRKIFQYLLEFNPTMKKGGDKTVEREVAAALESVFPRIGLKAFVQLRPEEKNSQLSELAHIVFGIRLFNRSQGRGGTDIENLDDSCEKLSREFEEQISSQVEKYTALCAEHQKIIVRAHLIKKRQDREKKELGRREAKSFRQSAFEVTDRLLDRWSQELINRRQYLSFLLSLQSESSAVISRLLELHDAIRSDLSTMVNLIAGKSAVSKEQVYPRFQSAATNWLLFWESYNILRARIKTYEVLYKYQSSYTTTISDTVLTDEATDEMVVEIALEAANLHVDEKHQPVAPKEHTLADSDDRTFRVLSRADSPRAVAESKSAVDSIDLQEKKSSGARELIANRVRSDSAAGKEAEEVVVLEEKASTGAVLLSVNSTPDFMSLPLELQGFCPWSMVNGRGLLIPGRPGLGVVRYENLYYVFDHLIGIKEFMEDPEQFLRSIRDMAMKHPELIHLLRLQASWFPTVAISKLLEGQPGDLGGVEMLIDATGKPLKRDVATGTPTHFVEQHIDSNYHWNEWELRRRALKMVNLRNCQTVAQQTDQSHFRRDNDTQVYMLRDQGTQSTREKGTNPPIKTTFIAGLRGVAPIDPQSGTLTVSRYIDSKGEKNKDNKMKAKVVTLTLDL